MAKAREETIDEAGVVDLGDEMIEELEKAQYIAADDEDETDEIGDEAHQELEKKPTN